MTYSSIHSSNSQISRSRIVSHFVIEGSLVYERLQCIYKFSKYYIYIKGIVHHKMVPFYTQITLFLLWNKKGDIFFKCVFIHAVKESKTPRPCIGPH